MMESKLILYEDLKEEIAITIYYSALISDV